MKSKLLKLLPLVLFSLAASGYSETTPAAQPSGSCYDQGHPVQASQMASGYNSPARIDVEGAWDFYLTGSFIYWQARMDGLSVGTYAFTPPTHPGRVLNPEFEFKPGFKVGIGMNSSFDNWNVYAEYTWIRDEMHTRHSVPLASTISGSQVAFWNSNATSFTSVRSNWEHSNNILDLSLGRAYYVGTRLTFLPFVGTRAYWMDQDFHVSYADSTVSPATHARTSSDADSWAIGARTGVQTSWLLGHDFRLIGNVAGSLAYQKFNADLHVHNTTGAVTANFHSHHGQITPNVEGAVGLGWGSYFASHEWHFDFAALYEFHYFWNQNANRALAQEATATRASGSGDLMYQGLTLTARLDF